jgi:hypothetical protein
VLGPTHVRRERPKGIVDDVADTDGGGEVVHERARAHELVDERAVEDRSAHEPQPGVACAVREIALVAGAEIVEHRHRRSLV